MKREHRSVARTPLPAVKRINSPRNFQYASKISIRSFYSLYMPRLSAPFASCLPFCFEIIEKYVCVVRAARVFLSANCYILLRCTGRKRIRSAESNQRPIRVTNPQLRFNPLALSAQGSADRIDRLIEKFDVSNLSLMRFSLA